MYGIYVYETDGLIDVFETHHEAKEALAMYEEQDMDDGNYTPVMYIIKTVDPCEICGGCSVSELPECILCETYKSIKHNLKAEK